MVAAGSLRALQVADYLENPLLVQMVEHKQLEVHLVKQYQYMETLAKVAAAGMVAIVAEKMVMIMAAAVVPDIYVEWLDVIQRIRQFSYGQTVQHLKYKMQNLLREMKLCHYKMVLLVLIVINMALQNSRLLDYHNK